MQAARNAIRLLRSAPPNPPAMSACRDGAGGLPSGSRLFSPVAAFAAAACSSSSFLDKQEVTDRVLHLLTSSPFVDPSKVSPAADFKKDLQLDMLDSVQVMMAVEEEFAVEIPNSEADKISSAAHLIDYIAAHPQAK